MALGPRVKKLEERMRETRVSPASELSQDDQDCLDIVQVAMRAHNYHDIEETAAWRRGRQLEQRLYPITPVHLDPLFGKLDRCRAFYSFGEIRGRDPVEGDILSYEDLARVFTDAVHDCMYNQLLREAWERQIKQLPYPLWSQNGLLYRRNRDSRAEVSWEESPDFEQDHPQYRWRRVEEDLGGDESILAKERMPITPAVIFHVDERGNYSVKPAGGAS